MHSLINKAVTHLLNQLQDKQWQYPVYQLVLSANGGMTFGRHNMDGSFDNLLEEDPGYIEYPVIIRLIDSQGGSIKAVVTKEGYEYSEN
jgi:hypothetical protein